MNVFSILNMNLLSKRVQHILDEARIEQADLVAASGASHSVVSQWLTGDIKSMRLEYALAIEERYGYDHVWLMINKGSPKKKKGDAALQLVSAPLDDVGRGIVDLVNIYYGLSPTGRDILLDAARSVADEHTAPTTADKL